MSLRTVPRRALAALRPRPVPWPTVVALAALMAYADGFVLTSIQGAVGAIERAQSPFATWLLSSTLLLPVYLLAVLAALAHARRRLGPALRSGRRIVAAALLVAAAGTLVGFGAVVTSAVYDYRLQSELVARIHATHAAGNQVRAPDAGTCTGLCASLEQTRAADERAARYATATDLGLNVVIVGWVLALRGGRLEIPERRALRRSSPAAAPPA
ncbi:hypothetical protein [Geodermatophilus sp. URMC 64]